MAALTWVRFNVAVLGQQRNDVLQVERTDLIAALLNVGYLSEVPAPPAPPVTPVDQVATPADVLSVVATALADPTSPLARAVTQQATAAAGPAASSAASAAAAAAVGSAAQTAATAALAAVAPQLNIVSGQLPRHIPQLRKWYANLAGRSVTPAQILVIGDSISEGHGSSTLIRRWQNVLMRNLRARVPTLGLDLGSVTDGAEWPYISAHYATSWPTGIPCTLAGNWTAADQFGLGKRAVQLNDGTASAVFTFTGTSCRLLYTRGSGAGVCRIVVDGGTATTVDSYQATGTAVGTWTSAALSRGAHTVTVTRDPTTASGRSVFVEGLLTFDGDETTGIRVVDGAHSGAWAQNFTTDTGWATSAAAVGPFGLLIYALGTNDFGGGRTRAQFKADTQTMIATLRGNGFAGSVLLLGLWKGYGRDETAWADYLAVLSEVAAADPDSWFLSLRDYMPDPSTSGTSGSLGLFVDGLHPGDAGFGYMGDVLAGALIPR